MDSVIHLVDKMCQIHPSCCTKRLLGSALFVCADGNQRSYVYVCVCVCESETVCVHSCDVIAGGLKGFILPRAAHLQFSEHHTERARLLIMSL